MTASSNTRATSQPKPSTKAAAGGLGSKDPRAARKNLGDLPGALVGLVREGRSATDHVVDAISESSAVEEQELQASLALVRERRREPGLDPEERLRLEAREDTLRGELREAGREKRAQMRGAHQDLLKYGGMAEAGVVAVGALATGNKDLVEKAVQIAAKSATRAITR
ncbi:MAG TPA: hypothetical protein H9987_00955 [Candidatus Luteococcus avicola]|nr:hypothetical protein [Candidatus Luteococcus avicola]